MGSLSDPIADLLTRIRNASSARHRHLDVRHSKLKEAIVKILIEQGFIAHYLVKEEKKKSTMRIFLKYSSKREAILNGLRRISKPSLRKFVSYKEIPSVLGGMGIAIVSTSMGIIDGRLAKEKKVGGELICLAW